MFKSPDTLRDFALELAGQLETNGFHLQSSILTQRANLPCTTGWEWLGELQLGVEQIRSMEQLPKEITEKLNQLSQAATSSTPYG